MGVLPSCMSVYHMCIVLTEAVDPLKLEGTMWVLIFKFLTKAHEGDGKW